MVVVSVAGGGLLLSGIL